jgi:gamma-glutamylcyclotransferase (GGCT)/AIG2-like uncharacterized protein YtfP
MIPVFSYGTLRDAEYQFELFGRTYPTEPATLPGWRVVVCEGGYFTVVADPAAVAAGDLVALDRQALAIADGWEGPEYRRLRVRTDAGDAWLYVRPTSSLTPPPGGVTALHPREDVLAAIRAFVRTR